MATAFQRNAFQFNAFQIAAIGGGIPARRVTEDEYRRTNPKRFDRKTWDEIQAALARTAAAEEHRQALLAAEAARQEAQRVATEQWLAQLEFRHQQTEALVAQMRQQHDQAHLRNLLAGPGKPGEHIGHAQIAAHSHARELEDEEEAALLLLMQ